jgi:polysaccharide transporter, PST family
LTLESTIPELTSVADHSEQAALGERIFRNTLTLIAGRVLGLVLSGAGSILLVRYLGSRQLGEYGALYAYTALYAWLATFGLESILAREAAKNRAQAGSILLTGVLLSTGFSLVATALVLLVAPRFGYSHELRLPLIFAAVDVLILAPLRLPGIVFQVDLRQWYGVGIGLLRQVIWLLALLVVAFVKAGLTGVIVGRMVCGIFEVTLILAVTYDRGCLLRPWRFLSAQARQYASYSFPIAASALAIGIFQRIDQVMLHLMTGDQALGWYVAAVNITELFALLPLALMSSLLPVFSRFASREDRFDHYLKLSFRSMMVVVFGACALVCPLAKPIIHLLYGPEFAAAAPLLAVIVWSEVPVFFGVVISNGLIAKNLQNYLALSNGVGAVVNIVLNLFMIPRWGALGAAWATNVSYSLAGIFVFLVFRSTRSMAWTGLRISIPPFLLTLPVTIMLLGLPLPVIAQLCIVATTYGLGVWVMGVVQRSEINQIGELIGGSFAFFRSKRCATCNTPST